ncbi:hypothetical protein QTP86_026032 [Hemibagrus guttatus]|nr:hypothetical protein QTP86_026032 [Hemibagrus guttatus]
MDSTPFTCEGFLQNTLPTLNPAEVSQLQGLLQLRQGTDTTTEYVVKFGTLAAQDTPSLARDVILKDVIYKVKTAFNTDFEAVYKQKEQEISRIRDKNKRIADIMSKLELQETLWEPTLSDNERPERALTVSDSEPVIGFPPDILHDLLEGVVPVEVKGATEGRTSDIDKELRTVQPGDWVYVKVFKRKWNEPKSVGPLKVILATPTALKVEGKNAWFHLNHLSQAQWGDARHSKILCYENSTGGDKVCPPLHHDHKSSKYQIHECVQCLSTNAAHAFPCTLGQKVLGEECQQYAETRRSLKKNVKELQEIIQAMMQENEKLPDIEKLELMEFNLDGDEQQRLQAEGEQEIAKVREEIEMENLAKSYLRDVLKKKYWDAMSVKEKAIKAFHSGCEVENFPMKERTAEELEELHRVEAIREMEKADTSAPLEEDEEDNCHEAGSLAFTGSLSAQYGGVNPHLYSQFDLHTRDQKMNQIILLQDVIYKVKTAFNTDFEAVYKQKEQVMSCIREKNKCLADIMSTLELQETLWEPTLSDNERPERALTVSDSEIKVEKYLTPEQRQREEEQRKEEEQRRLIEKEDDSRERALDDMMGGILEVKREDILKMEVPAPEFIDKPELQWTEEERGSYKEYERQVKKLREEQKSYRKEELKIANLLHSTIIEEEMLDREEELIYRLQEAKAVKNEIRKRLTNHREDVEDFQETYDTTVRGDKILGSGFRKEFCDVPRYTLDQLYKLYKRRPRIQIMRALTTEGLSHIMKAMEALDAPQNMPEGLDPAVWERFCLARRTKVKSEQKVKMKAMVLAEKQAFLQKIIDEEENAKMEIKNLVDELNCLRDERLTLSSNVIVQILLKQCQVEVENGDFAADYSDSLLFQRNVVEDLNNTIRALGKQQIAFMVEHKDLHKIIIQQEWEHKRLSMQIEDLRNNARDIQLLHQYREVLEYLTEPDYDDRMSKKVSSMEKTIESQEKIHRKNVKNCERLLKELGRQVKEKKKINAALDLKFTNLQVAVAERRNIYETTAFEENQQRKAKQRYRNIVQKRKLVDLAKAQDMDIAVLSTELKCVRMNTFPVLSQ